MGRNFTNDDLMRSIEDAEDDRTKRTPFTEAMVIMNVTLVKALAGEDLGPIEVVKRLQDEIYSPLLADGDFCEADINDAVERARKEDGSINLVDKVIGYCVLAVRAYFNEEDQLAWSFIADAQYWAAVIVVSAKRGQAFPISAGSALANFKHVGTRLERKKITDYWLSNVDRSLSAQRAADVILASGITNLSHKKIAEYVSPLRRAEAERKK